MSYEERQVPVTISHELVERLWNFVKGERDAALDTNMRLSRLEDLLKQMSDEGMAAHLATLEEVREALGAIQELDRASHAAFEAKMKRKQTRAKGTLI